MQTINHEENIKNFWNKFNSHNPEVKQNETVIEPEIATAPIEAKSAELQKFIEEFKMLAQSFPMDARSFEQSVALAIGKKTDIASFSIEQLKDSNMEDLFGVIERYAKRVGIEFKKISSASYIADITNQPTTHVMVGEITLKGEVIEKNETKSVEVGVIDSFTETAMICLSKAFTLTEVEPLLA